MPTARAVIKRRDYLVRLGLTKRKTGKKEEVAPPTMPGTPPEPGPVVPSPVPPPSNGTVPFPGID